MLITGILSVIISIILKHWVGKRKFYRRNVAGIEEFKSYGSAVITDLLEKFVSFIAKVLIILGIISIIASVVISIVIKEQYVFLPKT